MPQSTNLNKNPYYDDFNESKNFYKVLFKPGATVQARELTTLQSILQNQIEKLGSAFFKKGTVVVPGGFAYDSSFYAVEVESTYKGVEIENYFEYFVGVTLTGSISNVTAKVEKVISKTESTRSSTTFYVKYQNSSSNDFTSIKFQDGEELILNSNIDIPNSSILSGTAVAKLLSPLDRSATSIGSAAKIDAGIYFIRGFFVNIEKDTIVLDQYTNTPSYRVGLNIKEEIINSNQDSSLNDNAQGFSNYAAPGADRLKISLSLIKKSLDDFNDDSFVELFRVENGILRKIKEPTESSFITDILARRTFDESGNYYVNSFKVELLESLNNYLGNNGLYYPNQSTGNSIIPSKDIGVLKISPGKAYIKGYEVPTGTELLNYPKPRTVKNIENSSSSFYAGKLLRVNNVKNSPFVGLTTNVTIPLYNRRLFGGNTSGSQIGVARLYDFSSHITSQQNKSSQFDLRLFDIQTYSILQTDSTISSINNGDYIKGNNSGSAAYVKSISGQSLTLYQVSGNFVSGESLIVNEISSNIYIGTITNYTVDDIKSISTNNVFTADTLLNKEIPLIGPFTLISDGSTASISSNNGSSFASKLKVFDVVKYTQVGFSSYVFAEIISINSTNTTINLVGISTVVGVCNGNLGISTTLQNISIIRPQILEIDNSSLYCRLNNKDISNINFLNSSIYTKIQYNSVAKSSTTLTLPSLSGTNYVYAAYQAERYLVVNANGTLENLDNAILTITNGGKNAEFTSLTATSGPCKVITTQIKTNITQKSKKFTRSAVITISNTKYNPSRNVGLAYTSIYGTRVEDSQISLNVSDIIEVHGVFESSTTSNPILPWISVSGLNSPNSTTTDLTLGEVLVGSKSGSVAIYAQNKTNIQIYLVNKNSNSFILGETVTFQESGYTATISSINSGDKNILDNYTLDNGQRKHFYDFGRIVRKDFFKEPAGRLTIVFDYFTFNSNDYGDLISRNSYPENVYGNKIPIFDTTRNTDIIDIRPKVSDYNPNQSILSPFDFSSRDFSTPHYNSNQIIASNENFIFDYGFYLPRIDKITLSKDGVFNLVLGDPDEIPIEPLISTETLDIGTIIANPYVYNVKNDVKIILTDHKRYTMSDLRDIDNRVSNLEYYTSLSLLETSTQNLLIEDENGRNRFKSGFFVDEFNDYSFSNINDITYNSLIENKILSSTKNEKKIDLSLFYEDNQISIPEINIDNTTSTNLRITGNKISLKYSEVEQFKQPFASKVVNVNPFNIISWQGILELSPQRDTWSIDINSSTFIANASLRGQSSTTTSISSERYIRTRNINFNAVRLKPNTRFKLLFDSRILSKNNINVSSFTFPKLLEIENVTGTFQPGETVKCIDNNGNINSKFIICSPNHKSGPVNAPTLIFTKNPYNPSVGISTQYGNQSTLLNVDTLSLSRNDITGYWGNIQQGNTVVGETSKATAQISDVKLITNEEGVLIGSIFIRQEDQFTTGNSTVKLEPFETHQLVPGEIADSSASAIFTSEGTRITNTSITYYDPLAQTFEVSEDNGIIPTSVDVYFYTKDSNIPVTLEIREVSFGTPGGPDKVIPGLRKVLSASEVSISTNASIKTTFTFDELVRLEGGNEYAIVLVSDSNEYQVWVSEIGAEDISTKNSPILNKIFINKQPSLGTLFKSQNGTTWVSSPLEDLKFTLNKANFNLTSGTLKLYNAIAQTNSIENKLDNNPILTISTSSTVANDGYHFQVFQKNHGMYSAGNIIDIQGVQSDILPIKLTSSYSNINSGPISVASTAIFANFESSPVSPSNPGYIRISNEIIKYENLGTGQLLDITRGQYGTIQESYNIDDFVYKYEFNNVSLARINTQHTIATNPKPTLNNYYVQIGSGTSFTSTKFGGGDQVFISKNKQFNSIKLSDEFVTGFDKTQVSALMRTISSTSVDGSEISFIDQGSQSIGINSDNKFNTPRMVASRVNEIQYLNSAQFIGNKSLMLELNLTTSDSNISPLIDLTQNFVIGSIYNINQPIGINSYSTDNRVNSSEDDPNSFVYISNRVNLQQPANSLKVLLSAYRNVSSDIRVLYKIFTNNVSDNDQIWQLFPGYDNLDVNGNIINSNNNNGRSDFNVRSSLNDEYLDYSFNINELTLFTGFSIKIIGTSTNQAYSPLIKELRVIAIK